jgi:uncharacterized membrane protein YccC
MTGTAAALATTGRLAWPSVRGWLAAKDPGGLALRRSVRAAVFVPGVFALTHVGFSDPQVGLFGAFGSFALLLMVDFPGRPRTRFLSMVGLFLAGCIFITLGTVVSTHPVAAVVTMAVVGFVVLFAGILSPQVASASTAALLLFVLPVAVSAPASATGDRLIGWVIAGAFCIPACLLWWPTPWHDDLRRRLSATLSSVAALVESDVDTAPDPGARAAVDAELVRLRAQFAGTPYPPTGAVSGAVALAKLVGRAEWVASNAALFDAEIASCPDPVRSVVAAVSDTLYLTAALTCDGSGHPVDDPALVSELQDSVRRLDALMTSELVDQLSVLLDPGVDLDAAEPEPPAPGSPVTERSGIASVLDPTFRARALAIATQMAADAALEAAGAQAVGDRRLGTRTDPTRRTVWARTASHLSFRSVWFRNSVRGAAGLALAVAVVEVTDVNHGFWVVLGTLSVLRSNALGTGATALRAVAGTAVGFVIGSLIMVGVANHTDLLWGLLPLAVLVAGVAPAAISFAAGQAGFTVVVVILFNIIDPVGWKVGLTRIEDVAIGCGVSIVVGLLFWPRGATAALGRALADAFVTSSGYLAEAVSGLTATDLPVDTRPAQQASHRAYLRLDDAFRQFLAERGEKRVSVETVASLFTGSNRIRLAAFTLATLPDIPSAPDEPVPESVAVAGAELRDSYAASHHWYEEFADLLADRRDSLDPPPTHDNVLDHVLVEAFADARRRRTAQLMRTTLRMLWADELLENQRQVQADLALTADRFNRRAQKGHPDPSPAAP